MRKALSLSLCCVVCGVVAFTPAWATDPGIGWGNVSAPAGNSTQSTNSSDNHYLDSLTAITIENGPTTLLPGATLNAVGVLNEINVVGDNNVLDSVQTGTNTGDVTTTINVSE